MAMRVMLAEIGTKKQLNLRNYIYEPKLDGTRAVFIISRGSVKIINRRNWDLLYRYPEFSNLNQRFCRTKDFRSCELDGEIVYYNQKGLPDINILQKREHITEIGLIEASVKKYPATFAVFDIMELNGEDLTEKRLIQRKEILKKLLKDVRDRSLEFVPFTMNGKNLFAKIKKQNMEGVIAKRADSRYVFGRSEDWLKIKNLNTIDCIIVGFTQKKEISALALAVYIHDELTYIGKVSFDKKFTKYFLPRFRELRIKELIANNKPKEKINWIEPKYVAEIEYLGITKKPELKSPKFKRIREDRFVRECVLEF